MKIIFVAILGLFVLMIYPAFAEESNLQNLGEIKWLEFNIHSKLSVYQIQVSDQDMNKDSGQIDKFKIHVYSTSDPVGILVTVYETEKNSGVFDSIIYFSEDISTGQRLRVYDGEKATAKYEDHTLPASYNLNKLEISDTITIYYPIANLLEGQNRFIRIEDETFSRQSLLLGETISESGT